MPMNFKCRIKKKEHKRKKNDKFKNPVLTLYNVYSISHVHSWPIGAYFTALSGWFLEWLLTRSVSMLCLRSREPHSWMQSHSLAF